MTKVNQQDFEWALEWLSSGYGSEAYIFRTTGKILWILEGRAVDPELELPDDIGDPDKYFAVPAKYELDLGVPLVMDFVYEMLPREVETVREMFRSRGAYGRFKALLERKGMLQQWYDYESRCTHDALQQWCMDHGLELVSTSSE
ncbi:MAG: hypothetical protein WC997_01870 [Porticoccaceae bacterium]